MLRRSRGSSSLVHLATPGEDQVGWSSASVQVRNWRALAGVVLEEQPAPGPAAGARLPVPAARVEPEHDLVVGVVRVVDEQPDRGAAAGPGAVVVVAVGDHLAVPAHLLEGPGADQPKHHRAAGVDAAPDPGQLVAGQPGHPRG